jgi:hypothetical protein
MWKLSQGLDREFIKGRHLTVNRIQCNRLDKNKRLALMQGMIPSKENLACNVVPVPFTNSLPCSLLYIAASLPKGQIDESFQIRRRFRQHGRKDYQRRKNPSGIPG